MFQIYCIIQHRVSCSRRVIQNGLWEIPEQTDLVRLFTVAYSAVFLQKQVIYKKNLSRQNS